MKIFFRVKTSQVEKIVIEKWYNRWLNVLTSILLLGPDLHCVRSPGWQFIVSY